MRNLKFDPNFEVPPFFSKEETLEATQLRLLRRANEAEIRVLRRPQSLSSAYPGKQTCAIRYQLMLKKAIHGHGMNP